MINFFRKIRYDFIEKNKTGKYLKYAIGEIALVVIGILIALQINIWNENRKIEKEELLILNTLFNDLIIAKKASETNIQREQELTTSLLFLINFHSNNSALKKPAELDLIFHRGLWNLGGNSPVLSAYSDYKNTGEIRIIKNKNLRKKFTDLEVSLNLLKEMTKDRSNVQQIRIDNILEKDVNFVRLIKSVIPKLNVENGLPNDYDLILKNSRIRNLLAIKLIMSIDVLTYTKGLDVDILEIMTLIETELSNEN